MSEHPNRTRNLIIIGAAVVVAVALVFFLSTGGDEALPTDGATTEDTAN